MSLGNFGREIGEVIAKISIVILLIIAIVCVSIGVLITRSMRPTEQDLIKARERQQVIEELTPRQREALGLSR